jgi:putative iron-regulated protein
MARWRTTRQLVGICVGVFAAECALAAPAPSPQNVIAHYADLAEAIYGDSLSGARDLQTAVNAFLANPTEQTLAKAREAWKTARIPYLQTEGFRFGSNTVDDWEPRVNAWPLDEGLIDYVAPSYGTRSDLNPLYALNVVGKTSLRVGAKIIDAKVVDASLLRKLQEAEGVQTNVSTGYHAIEFLLWGQNLDGPRGGSGKRPASDYDTKACTHGHCDRRAAYLNAAVGLLVADLEEMKNDWHTGGKAREELVAKGPQEGLSEILTGLGSLTFGEMAGERMKLGLMLHDPEEQQDCFSNNTHNSHYFDEIGIGQIWRGHYVRADGTILDGPSIRAYAAAADPASAQRLDSALDQALATIGKMKTAADSGRMAYSQMIAAGNAEGNRMVQESMDALVAQTRAIEGVAAALHLNVASNKSDHNAGAGGLR